MSQEHNLGRLAARSAETLPEHDSLFFEGTWHTNTQIADRVSRVATGLAAQGIAPGDRVVVLMMNTPEVMISYQAIWRAGAVVMPVIFLISPDELRHVLADSGAVAAIVSHELVGVLRSAGEAADHLKVFVVGDMPEGETQAQPYAVLEAGEAGGIVDRDDDDLAALLYTGGTTGRAKGVMLTHDGLWSSGWGLHQNGLLAPPDRQSTVSLLPLPLSHAYGLIVTITGLHTLEPRKAVLQRWFDAKGWLELVQEHRVQTSPTVPSMLAMLLALPLEDYDLSSLLTFGSGGAPLPDALYAEIGRRLPNVEIIEGYGLTESSAVVSANQSGQTRRGSVGRALPHAEVAILDLDGKPVDAGVDGEVCVRGAGVMAGYWKSPAQTADTVVDGWLHTGDIGHLDEDGYLFIVDRLKDLVIRGGFNVYPRDVEEVLLGHPDVTSAAVVGRPDPRVGEEVVAFVSVRPGAAVTGEELTAWSREHLAAHKYPREVRVVDSVPLTSVGKTDRKAVRALLAQPAHV